MHRAGRIKRSSITTWGTGAAYFIRPRELGCGILFRALGMLSTAKNFHKTAICHLRRHSSLSPCVSPCLCLLQFPFGPATCTLAFLFFLACPCKTGVRDARMHLRSCCYTAVYDHLKTLHVLGLTFGKCTLQHAYWQCSRAEIRWRNNNRIL